MKQNITQYLLVVMLVVGAYMVGVYKTKAEYLEGVVPGQVAEVAGDQVVPNQEEKTELTDDEWARVQEGASFVMGEESAAVTIVEFSDYECPFCKRYNDETFNLIKSSYIDTGMVRYMIRDLPLPFHPSAKLAAVAARCAGREEKYLPMHDRLFLGQEEWAGSSDSSETYVSYAGELGLATSSFRACLTDSAVVEAVQNDALLAGEMGASGTPSFFINGTALVGAQPFTAFEALIEANL